MAQNLKIAAMQLRQEVFELFGSRSTGGKEKIQGGPSNGNTVTGSLDPAAQGALADRFLAIAF